MVTMNYSFELDCNERDFFKILTNYENLSNYLPRKLKKIEILDAHDNYTTIEATILLRTIIKKEFSQKIRIEKKSEKDISIEILGGIAKGTHITISVLMQKEKTLCNVNSDVKLSLKTVILYPIIKKEYNSFLSGVFKKMSIDAKQTKEK
jgi:carbon monoxide dehydrogenase subunit G